MSEKHKVFIPAKGYHNWEAAARYGELVFMSNEPFSRAAVSNMIRTFEPFIEESDSEDYIVITGLSVMCSLACSLFVLKHGRLNLLLFDAASSKYIKRTVILREEKESEIVGLNS